MVWWSRCRRALSHHDVSLAPWMLVTDLGYMAVLERYGVHRTHQAAKLQSVLNS